MEKNAIVLYKNQFAITGESEGDKIHLRFCVHPASSGKKAVFGEQKVRQKDFVLLHKGPCTDFDAALSFFDDNIFCALCHKHTYTSFLINNAFINQKIHSLRCCSRINGIKFGKFISARHLFLFEKNTSHNIRFYHLTYLQINRLTVSKIFIQGFLHLLAVSWFFVV